MKTVVFRLAFLCAAAFLAGLILWAYLKAPFFESFTLIASMPWGWVSLVDLYLGFAILAAFMVRFEENLTHAIAWIIALLVLGNVVGAFWLAIRGWDLVMAKPKPVPAPEEASSPQAKP